MAQTFRAKDRIITLRALHLVLSLVVWQHFFYNKFRRNEIEIPIGSTNRDLKR
jgi:hypothetical protein